MGDFVLKRSPDNHLNNLTQLIRKSANNNNNSKNPIKMKTKFHYRLMVSKLHPIRMSVQPTTGTLCHTKFNFKIVITKLSKNKC